MSPLNYFVTMSPPRITESKIVVIPLKHRVDRKCEFGATITGLDLNDISNEDLEILREATHKYQLLMIMDQHWDLVSRLDLTVPQVHVHESKKTEEILSVCFVHPRPEL
jgi:hypothetical protein